MGVPIAPWLRSELCIPVVGSMEGLLMVIGIDLALPCAQMADGQTDRLCGKPTMVAVMMPLEDGMWEQSPDCRITMPPDQPSSVDGLIRRRHILATELRAVQHARARGVSGAIVHRLDNLLSNASLALYLTESTTMQEQPETIALLVSLAEASLREARALLY